MPWSPTRDAGELTDRLERWLSSRLSAPVTVDELSAPRAGYSNETVLGRAQWVAGDGTAHRRRFVLRVEPSAHQVFVEPDAIRQARVMQGLAGRVPVPGVWLTEADPAVLGAPFYVMDLVAGRVPSDLPSWHKRGWVTELAPADRRRFYDNALRGLAGLHRLDWRDRLGFLEPPGPGSFLDRYLDHVGRFYEWCTPALRFDTEVIAAALDHVVSNRPAVEHTGVVWGDARVGNIIFDDDLAVAAMVDWEGASVGPPEIDVGWWLMFETYLCEAQGLARPAGIPGRDATVARYEELAGRSLVDIGYFEILAGLVFSLINSRIAQLLVAEGRVPEGIAAEYVTRVTTLTRRWLER